jgi:glycosyltransferase involved in cell wall biosynthesis
MAVPTDHIIAVSQSVKDFIVKYEFIPKNHITVIYHGIVFDRYKTDDENVQQRLHNLGINTNTFVIGIVGRLTEQKGHRYLFDAVSLVKEYIKPFRLLIFGVGELKQQLQQYRDNLGLTDAIIFMGYEKHLAPYYRIMDVLCLPSIYEGLGLVLVEAMICGTIVVGSAVHGIKEIIDDNKNGFLVPPRDSQALAEILCRISQKKYGKKIHDNAHNKAKQFDFRKNMKKIEACYINIMASSLR